MELSSRHYWLFCAGIVLLFLLLIVTIGGLEKQLVDEVEDLLGYGGPHSDEITGSRDLFHAGVPITGLKQGESYGAYDRRRDEEAITDYFSFGCLGDCRLHKAGYRWAVKNRILNPRDCLGPSWAFLEGCAAFALKEQ